MIEFRIKSDDVLDYVRTSPLQFMNCSVRETIFSLIERISIPDDIEIVIDKFDMNIECDPEKNGSRFY